MSEAVTVGPHWIEYVRAFGPVIIGLVVAYIAFMQWRLAKSTLNEKLFDRRFEIIQHATRLVFQSNLVDEKEQRSNEHEVMQRLNEAKYLFSPKVELQLKELVSASRVGRRLERKEIKLSGEERENAINELAKEMDANQVKLNETLQEIDRITGPWMHLGRNK